MQSRQNVGCLFIFCGILMYCGMMMVAIWPPEEINQRDYMPLCLVTLFVFAGTFIVFGALMIVKVIRMKNDSWSVRRSQ